MYICTSCAIPASPMPGAGSWICPACGDHRHTALYACLSKETRLAIKAKTGFWVEVPVSCCGEPPG